MAKISNLDPFDEPPPLLNEPPPTTNPTSQKTSNQKEAPREEDTPPGPTSTPAGNAIPIHLAAKDDEPLDALNVDVPRTMKHILDAHCAATRQTRRHVLYLALDAYLRKHGYGDVLGPRKGSR